MRHWMAAAIALAASPALAADWVPMTGDDIRKVLTGAKAQYDGAWQTFSETGRTLYNAGQDSWGYWQIRGDKYCSQWPPGDQWDCYSMESSKDGMIRFIGEFGDITEGTLVSE